MFNPIKRHPIEAGVFALSLLLNLLLIVLILLIINQNNRQTVVSPTPTPTPSASPIPTDSALPSTSPSTSPTVTATLAPTLSALSKVGGDHNFNVDGDTLNFKVPADFTETALSPALSYGASAAFVYTKNNGTNSDPVQSIDYYAGYNTKLPADSSVLVSSGQYTFTGTHLLSSGTLKYQVRSVSDSVITSYFVLIDSTSGIAPHRTVKLWLAANNAASIQRAEDIMATFVEDQD